MRSNGFHKNSGPERNANVTMSTPEKSPVRHNTCSDAKAGPLLTGLGGGNRTAESNWCVCVNCSASDAAHQRETHPVHQHLNAAQTAVATVAQESGYAARSHNRPLQDPARRGTHTPQCRGGHSRRDRRSGHPREVQRHAPPHPAVWGPRVGHRRFAHRCSGPPCVRPGKSWSSRGPLAADRTHPETLRRIRASRKQHVAAARTVDE